MNQTKLPGFAPPPVHRCRVCRRRLTEFESIAAGIGPKCKAAGEKDEADFLERMDGWNAEGNEKTHPFARVADVKRLLGIIGRLKNEMCMRNC